MVGVTQFCRWVFPPNKLILYIIIAVQLMAYFIRKAGLL